MMDKILDVTAKLTVLIIVMAILMIDRHVWLKKRLK